MNDGLLPGTPSPWNTDLGGNQNQKQLTWLIKCWFLGPTSDLLNQSSGEVHKPTFLLCTHPLFFIFLNFENQRFGLSGDKQNDTKTLRLKCDFPITIPQKPFVSHQCHKSWWAYSHEASYWAEVGGSTAAPEARMIPEEDNNHSTALPFCSILFYHTLLRYFILFWSLLYPSLLHPYRYQSLNTKTTHITWVILNQTSRMTNRTLHLKKAMTQDDPIQRHMY